MCKIPATNSLNNVTENSNISYCIYALRHILANKSIFNIVKC